MFVAYRNPTKVGWLGWFEDSDVTHRPTRCGSVLAPTPPQGNASATRGIFRFVRSRGFGLGELFVFVLSQE